MTKHTLGPVEALARLSLQSERYSLDAEFHRAVDAVLGNPIYDAGPGLLKACKAAFLRFNQQNGHVSLEVWNENYAAYKALKIAIAKAEGAA